MGTLKKLAGQTAIYGMSSIIGRILNYLLVPLYTRVFTQEEYGVVILMYSFVAVIFIILTYGMETAYFRFSELEKNKKSVYNTAISSLLVTTFVFLVATLMFSGNIATWIKYPDQVNFVKWLAIILALDTLTTIPFARLRAENRPGRFATIKLINIGVNIGLNLFFVLFCPWVIKNSSEGFVFNFVSLVFKPELGLISYVFISNLVASSLTLLLLLPEIFKFQFKIDKIIWNKMIKYAWPLLLTGIAGIMNETIGRVLLRYLLPEEIAEQQLGIYAASFKIAILLSLFVQAFRYAAEPFFFAQEREKDSKVIYARVMKYFVLTVSIIFLGIMMYLDVVILVVGENFREGVAVIPILLLAYVFLGIFYNLSIWYKLTNKTLYGAMIAMGGAIITIVLNLVWIPVFSYMGSAWATFFCYLFMMVVSFIMGRKIFPVPYETIKIVSYLLLAVAFYFVSIVLKSDSSPLNYVINLSHNLI